MLGFLKRMFGGGKGGDRCDHGPQTTPEEEFAIAERVMAAGELRHAAIHLGNALSDDPLRAEWLAFLDRLITIAPDPLDLAPLGENNYVGTVALHAYVLNHLGRFEEALNCLLQASVTKPTVPYLEWAVRWLEDPANANRMSGASFMHLMQASFENPDMLRDPKNRPFTDRLPRLVEAVRRTQSPEPEFYVATARVLRMSGHPESALAMARTAYDEAPGFATAISVAATLRDAGDIDGALAMYRKASDADPSDVSALLDMGDMTWETAGRREEAAGFYEEALAKEPEHPWAAPSLYALRYEMTGDEEWRVKLAAYANANAGNDRARFLASRCVFPYFGSYLPDPVEATVNIGRQMLEKIVEAGNPAEGKINLSVSAVESPSAISSVEREWRRRGFRGSLNVTFANVARPDPRKPRGPVTHVLWHYEGTKASPGLPEPPADVAEAVATLARTPYSVDAWWREAQKVGAGLGTEAIPAVLAVMVHPPDPPEDVAWWTWTYRVQVAAALIVAGTDAKSPWAESARRAALLSLVRGPMDWSVEAGILALTVVAREDPQIADEAKALLFETLRTAPRDGYVNYRDTALCALAQLPNLSERERADVNKQFQKLQQEQGA